MDIQRILHLLPPTLRRHKLIRALTFLHPKARIQRVQFNSNAEVLVDVREATFRQLLIMAEFDPEYFRIASAFLRTGGIYFDVGANAGLCSFGLIPFCPKVEYHLFEANPRLWGILRQSMELHNDVNMHLVEGAVGERDGFVCLDAENPDGDIGQGFICEGDTIRTHMLTLDEYIQTTGIPRVEFAKMDIEGYEFQAIEGSREAIRAGKLPVIYFELKRPLVERFGKSPGEVLDRFRSLGYILYHVRNQDFAMITAPRNVDICGLQVAPVTSYPCDLWTDLLAVHESATHNLLLQTAKLI